MNFSVGFTPYATKSIKQKSVNSNKSIAFYGSSDSSDSYVSKRHKIKHPLKKAAILGVAAWAGVTLTNCSKTINEPPTPVAMEEVQQNAIDLQLNLKFEKADLIYDINNILDGKKISQYSLDLYMANISSDEPDIYMSEDSGQMMDVLAIASVSDVTKDQVPAESLKPYLIKTLQYDDGGLFDETGDIITGSGEPWHYIAAAIIDKHMPKYADYMPVEEKEALQGRGFFESLWDDIKTTAGKGEERKQYLGDILENRDHDYLYGILVDDANWPFAPSDNPWFGPAAVGYSIRGNLNNLDGMSLEEIELFRDNYALNKQNQKKFAENPEYAQKVISSYVVKYMMDAVLENSGVINSGLAALGLQEAGYMDDAMDLKLIEQITAEASKIHLFNSETPKLDAAIKAYVIERDDQYSKLSAETRAEIRSFQGNNPESTATSVFMLAEESYYRKLSKEVEKHSVFQEALAEEVNKPDEEKNLSELVIKALELKNYNSNLLKIVKKELEVAKLTEDEKLENNFKNIQANLIEQNSQVDAIISNVRKYEVAEALNLQLELNNKLSEKQPTTSFDSTENNDENINKYFDVKNYSVENIKRGIDSTIENGKDLLDGVIADGKAIYEIIVD